MNPTTTASNADFNKIAGLGNSTLTPEGIIAILEKMYGIQVTGPQLNNIVNNGVTQQDLNNLVLETGNLTIEQINLLIKLYGLQSSASEIDNSVNNTFKFVIGENLYDLSTDTELLDIAGFSGTLSDGALIYENSNSNTKFSSKTLMIGNTVTDNVSTYTDRSKSLARTLDISDIDFVTCWVFVPESHLVKDGFVSSDFGSFRFLFVDSAGNYTGSRFADSIHISLQSGWNNISIPISYFTVNSTSLVNKSDIVSFRFQFRTQIGNNASPIYIDSIILGAKKLDKVPVCITLDDGTTDTYEMTKIMNKYGIPVSTFVTPSYIDSSTATGYLNIEHLDELYRNGNHIGIHGTGASAFASNPSLILEARDWLISKGFTKEDGHLYGTYPNGGYSQETINILRANNFKGFRQVTGVARQDAYQTQATKGGLPYEMILNGGIADPLKVSGNRPATYTEFVNALDKAIDYQAGYLPYHHLFSEVGGYTEWEKMAKYLKTKIDDGTIECLTFPQFCKKYS